MLSRKPYEEERREEMKKHIVEMMEYVGNTVTLYESYFTNPTEEMKETIFTNRSIVYEKEANIEQLVIEIFSLDRLNEYDIKWFFTINRIIRELERCIDNLINILNVSDLMDVGILSPHILPFFEHETKMLTWLQDGFMEDNIVLLDQVIAHDEHINRLNKATFQKVAQGENVRESELKLVVIGRFLERFGDHLVNIAKMYKKNVTEGREDM